DLSIPNRVARVAVEIGALHGPALLDGQAGDPLADADADEPTCGLEVQAGCRRQLGGGGIEREETARLHAEHLARLIQDEPDGLADLEALIHGAPGFVEGLRLSRAPLTLFEEAGVLDRDAGLVGETLEQLLVPCGEEARRRGERRDDA